MQRTGKLEQQRGLRVPADLPSAEPEMEEEQDALPPAQSCPGQPDQANGSGEQAPEEPEQLTPAELFDSKKPGAAAA
eukprot:3703007-Amphidinium_carterae.2